MEQGTTLFIEVKFQEKTCVLHKTTYLSGGKIALYLTELTTPNPVKNCTLNLPDVQLNENEVIVDAEVYEELVRVKAISHAKRFIQDEFNTYPVCDCLI